MPSHNAYVGPCASNALWADLANTPRTGRQRGLRNRTRSVQKYSQIQSPATATCYVPEPLQQAPCAASVARRAYKHAVAEAASKQPSKQPSQPASKPARWPVASRQAASQLASSSQRPSSQRPSSQPAASPPATLRHIRCRYSNTCTACRSRATIERLISFEEATNQILSSLQQNSASYFVQAMKRLHRRYISLHTILTCAAHVKESVCLSGEVCKSLCLVSIALHI